MREAPDHRSALLALTVLLVLVPAAQAQEVFGSQVRFGDNDFMPTYDAVVPVAAPHRYLYVAGEAGDALYLNVDGDDPTRGVEVNDVRLTPHGNHTAGTLVGPQDAVGAVAPGAASVGAFYGDLDGNGRFTAGDTVYLTGSATADGLHAATGGSRWTLRLTDTAWGRAGTLVLAGDGDLNGGVLPFEVDGDPDGGTPAAPELSLGLFNDDRDQGLGLSTLTPGDRLYLEVDATPAATAPAGPTAPGDPVSLHSIRLVGDPGGFGGQVRFGDFDFAPSLSTSPFDLVRHDGADDTTFADDLIALRPGAGGGTGLREGDVVLTSGSGGKDALDRLGAGDAELLGRGTAAIAGVETGFVYADVDSNGRYTRGDYVYLVGDDSGYAPRTELDATVVGEDAYFALRLTATSGGAAGTLVAAGDKDLADHGEPDGVAAMDRSSLAYFDADLDGSLGDGDRAYFSGGRGLLDLYALRLHGDLGGYGAQVVFGDPDLVPQVIVHGTIAIVRYLGTDADSASDDVIVLDADADGGAIEAGDLVLTASGRGTHVASGSSLVGKGSNDGTVGLVYVDRDGDGRYGAGDWVYLRESTGAGSLVATEGSLFTLRLTATDGGAAGTFVEGAKEFTEADEDLKDWNVHSAALNSFSDVGILDADRDGGVSPGDRVYFTEGIRLVDLHAVRLVGGFEARAAPAPTGPPGPADPAGPTDPAAPSDPGGPTEPAPPGDPAPPPAAPHEGGEESPGAGPLAVLAVLGAVLALVRRRA